MPQRACGRARRPCLGNLFGGSASPTRPPRSLSALAVLAALWARGGPRQPGNRCHQAFAPRWCARRAAAYDPRFLSSGVVEQRHRAQGQMDRQAQAVARETRSLTRGPSCAGALLVRSAPFACLSRAGSTSRRARSWRASSSARTRAPRQTAGPRSASSARERERRRARAIEHHAAPASPASARTASSRPAGSGAAPASTSRRILVPRVGGYHPRQQSAPARAVMTWRVDRSTGRPPPQRSRPFHTNVSPRSARPDPFRPRWQATRARWTRPLSLLRHGACVCSGPRTPTRSGGTRRRKAASPQGLAFTCHLRAAFADQM